MVIGEREVQNSANHLIWVEWPSKFDSLNGRDGRPRPSHLSAGWRCEWRELDSLKSKRIAICFLRVLSGRKASHGAARPPRPTISGNPACSPGRWLGCRSSLQLRTSNIEHRTSNRREKAASFRLFLSPSSVRRSEFGVQCSMFAFILAFILALSCAQGRCRV